MTDKEIPTEHLPSWNAFLNSLATSGGNIFMLFMMSLILLVVSLYLMTKFGPGAPAVITLVGAFGTFTGALVGILKGSRVDPVPSNLTSTTSTTTSTIPPPVTPEAPKP